jgi:anti-sigma factor RsiW
MTCEPERIKAYVDGALEDAARAELEDHLAQCSSCRAEALTAEIPQAGFVSVVTVVPATAADPEAPADLTRRVESPRRVRRRGAILVPVIGSLALLAFWVRGAPPFLVRELLRDHGRCFTRPMLEAKVWSEDPVVVAAWFENQGTSLPLVPATVAGLELVGGRYCLLLDRFAAHLYYVADNRHLSLFVIKGPARFVGSYEATIGGRTVQLFRAAGTTVGIVSERAEDVEAFRRSFTTTIAAAALRRRPRA